VLLQIPVLPLVPLLGLDLSRVLPTARAFVRRLRKWILLTPPIPIRRVGNSIFIPLPLALQRPCGGCSCAWCKKHPQYEPAWDTLAVPAMPERGRRDTTWTVHYPQLNSEHLPAKRES
jgi:hypothetical protein